MFKSVAAVAFVASLTGVAGCASKAQTIGTATGAAVGAAVTNGGKIGTLGGAMIGYGMGRAYEERHR